MSAFNEFEFPVNYRAFYLRFIFLTGRQAALMKLDKNDAVVRWCLLTLGDLETYNLVSLINNSTSGL